MGTSLVDRVTKTSQLKTDFKAIKELLKEIDNLEGQVQDKFNKHRVDGERISQLQPPKSEPVEREKRKRRRRI
jgi:hypothetical protein